MPSVCLYFQVHQPFRLRRYSVFDTDRHYFDEALNAQIMQTVVSRCYLPANAVLLDLIRTFEGRFRVAFSLTGCVVEQMQRHAPDALRSFQALAETGCVEFLAETYYHSLAFLYSREEFREQVRLHGEMVQRLFGQTPRVFRNTELVYGNDLAHFVGHLGYRGALCEGADQVLGVRSPNVTYRPPGSDQLTLLLKNYRLSDDIAFRFSNHTWEQHPVTAEKFAAWINQINGNGQLCNLFMDYEVFGEHQRAETGIFEFLRHLPGHVLDHAENDFVTPSQAVQRYPVSDVLDVPNMTSWADSERDLSAWLGNAMQSNAMHEFFKLEGRLKERGDEELLADWRRLGSSDHVYYMSTKYFADGTVHKYFSPYESPYDSYINFMNVLDNVQSRLKG